MDATYRFNLNDKVYVEIECQQNYESRVKLWHRIDVGSRQQLFECSNRQDIEQFKFVLQEIITHLE